ncbi:hypothetical protein [Pseudobacteriovorax antillogorgiicola]|uniref:23S rRNA G2445 N2-methylase RlmL n=1 Tax=Pseudobacteriovorax antillogorgiicola TaxID=1513793 RepID=A0A1Y6C6F2_9BACT|nr:hypothetical protein [Pseudobacteriovorax antillogorgiicola]TCS49332.1 23S rRNA G2445 N2-methylase RlmL [Pseudobacteriovorax antillogorgiicola]SMF47983.1 23S rRNA G2445 N2-methylase RlmL [Pseudobacteriovorax antillogorgiicola]
MEKKFKKSILSKPQAFLIEPPAGLSQFCMEELKDLLQKRLYPSKYLEELTETDKYIHLTNTDFRTAIEVVFRSRLCRDLWFVLGDRHVGSFGELERVVAKLPWELFSDSGAAFNVDVQSFQSKLYHEGKVRELVAQTLGAHGMKLSTAKDGLCLRLLQTKNRLQILLSLAGEKLYKRGFKPHTATKAPLQETLAAGLLWPLRHHKYNRVLVPFAGSGTLGFEAIMQLKGYWPGSLGRTFHVESFPGTPQSTVDFLKAKSPITDPSSWDLAMDFIEMDLEQVKELQSNSSAFRQQLMIEQDFNVICDDFFKLDVSFQASERVLMPLNPPYGLRLGHGSEASYGFFARLAKRVLALSSKPQALQGFCMLPDEKSYSLFRQIIGGGYEQTVHINQGGRHVRVLYFSWEK